MTAHQLILTASKRGSAPGSRPTTSCGDRWASTPRSGSTSAPDSTSTPACAGPTSSSFASPFSPISSTAPHSDPATAGYATSTSRSPSGIPTRGTPSPTTSRPCSASSPVTTGACTFVRARTPRPDETDEALTGPAAMLFSGGADSLAGAVITHNQLGESPILSSHRDWSLVSGQQNILLGELDAIWPDQTTSATATIGRSKHQLGSDDPFGKEETSRARSLLFIALGLAFAEPNNAALIIPENGFASLNPPMGGERRGALSTRTTHPWYLTRLQHILDRTGAHADLHNPFEELTKAQMFTQVAGIIGRNEASVLLSKSGSCAHGDNRFAAVRDATHCGVCFGCIVRRAAFHGSGLDDLTLYVIDDLTLPVGAHNGWYGEKRARDLQAARVRGQEGCRPRRHHRESPRSRRPLRRDRRRTARPRRGRRPHPVTTNWPPLDTHAHIDTTIDPRTPRTIRAVIFAATRTLTEFEQTLTRDDAVTVWGVGAHPGVPDTHADFTVSRLAEAITRTPLVSEVGLDGRSPVPMATQRTTFEAVVSQLIMTPRLVSIHSTAATRHVIATLRQHPIPGVLLHWWRGTPDETAEAVELGCHFSINTAERSRPAVLHRVPTERILTETDHPHGPRTGAKRPGDTAPVEQMMAEAGIADPRHTAWRTLAALTQTASIDAKLFPPRLRAVIDAAAQLDP